MWRVQLQPCHKNGKWPFIKRENMGNKVFIIHLNNPSICTKQGKAQRSYFGCSFFGINHLFRNSAIYYKLLSSDESSLFVVTQEQTHFSNILGLSYSSSRMPSMILGSQHRIPTRIRIYPSRKNSVYTHTPR